VEAEFVYIFAERMDMSLNAIRRLQGSASESDHFDMRFSMLLDMREWN
jgi:hypothetical protein